MSKWRHLFVDGEVIARSRLLSGLTLAQATTRPSGAEHSIYDELWHAANGSPPWSGATRRPQRYARRRASNSRLPRQNAYHLGKVAALRQAIGAWPPETR